MYSSPGKLPQKFEICYECFTITLFNRIFLKDGKLMVSEMMVGDEIEVNDEQWDKFWRIMDEIDIWNWHHNYENVGVLDGCTWSVKISYNGKKVNSKGMNSWPENFDIFERALKNLTGFDIAE